MMSTRWIPTVTFELAHKWLNCDTYWDIAARDLCAPDGLGTITPARAERIGPADRYPKQLLEWFPITDQAGNPHRSHLHDLYQTSLYLPTAVEQLVAQMKEAVAVRDWTEALTKIDQIERVCLGALKSDPNTDRLQMTEARLECALAYRAMGDPTRALAMLALCIKEFQTASDTHGEAVARWIAGYFQLETPSMFDEGIVNWRRAWEIFAKLAGEGNERTRVAVQWYKCRADLMARDLQTAIARHGISSAAAVITPPVIVDVPPPAPPPPLPVPQPLPSPVSGTGAVSLADTWLRLAQIKVFDSIGASPSGQLVDETPSSFLVESIESDRIRIGDKIYQVFDMTAGARTIPKRLVSLEPGDFFVRVGGDSMNRAKPYPIDDGDYVLVRPDDEPANGLIAAVRFANPDLDARLGVIKRLRDGSLHSESTTAYPPIQLKDVAKFVGYVVAVAKPV